jgi:DNA-binding LytR/AlgR family response regulator
MKVLIVEDESLAAQSLEMMLEEILPGVEVMATLGTIRDSVAWLKDNRPDLIFLDIHLSDGNSFRIFDKVDVEAPVIFTTAYDQYAIKAFKVNSIDYLLKPIDKRELEKAIDKYRSLRSKERLPFDPQVIVEAITGKKSYRQRFLVYAGDQMKSLRTEEVAWFNIMEKHVFLTTFSNHHYGVEYSLDKLEKMVDPELFFRVNRRYIINLNAIKTMVQLSRSRIKVKLEPEAGEDVIVSVHRIGRFRKWLNG